MNRTEHGSAEMQVTDLQRGDVVLHPTTGEEMYRVLDKPTWEGAELRVPIIYADGGEDERVFGMNFTLNVRRP